MEALTLDHNWWMSLTPPWKKAFEETTFHHPGKPTKEELDQVFNAPALRFAGPTAPYPNMSFELTDLSGIPALINLEILVVVHHKIKSVKELSMLNKLQSIFLYNNAIASLEGIEDLVSLKQLYVQWNVLESIKPIRKLTNLQEIYIHDNKLSEIDGLTEDHSDNLETFFIKPNERIKNKELMRVERELNIKCKSL